MVSDEVPCVVKNGGEWEAGVLNARLSNGQMAKVCYEDGFYKDVWWTKVRRLGVSELMDEWSAYYDEDDE